MDDGPFLSESIQMYLVSILRLGEGEEPVPLSRLAAALDVSPVSVNQMCRKLQDQRLVVYIPYKGASLTPDGQQLAANILRRHRVWEVFLVDHLQMTWQTAHQAACALEHATPDEVIERLDVFLGHPSVNPEGEPIPPSSGIFSSVPLHPLARMEVGQTGHFVQCTADEPSCAFLAGQGVRPGVPFQVVAAAPHSLLVEVEGRRLTLTRALATALLVKPEEEQAGVKSSPPQKLAEDEGGDSGELSQVSLDRLAAGQQGIIVRVGGESRLRRRLLEMGMVPGETITVERMAPLGDPVELTVKGYHLTLRKAEAAQITVELDLGAGQQRSS